MTSNQRRRNRPAPRRAFTLIETGAAIVVIGVGVLALLAAQVAFHSQNRWSTHASRAAFLANEIRETMVGLPRHDAVTGSAIWGPEPNEISPADWDDLDDFDGAVFSGDDGNGPIDASRRFVPGLEGWSQRVRVTHVDPFAVNVARPRFSTAMVHVEVVVSYRAPGEIEARELARLSWLQP